jgi:hypothetical protein
MLSLQLIFCSSWVLFLVLVLPCQFQPDFTTTSWHSETSFGFMHFDRPCANPDPSFDSSGKTWQISKSRGPLDATSKHVTSFRRLKSRGPISGSFSLAVLTARQLDAGTDTTGGL